MARKSNDYCEYCSRKDNEYWECPDCPVVELGYLSEPDAYYGNVLYFNPETHDVYNYSYRCGNVDDADVNEGSYRISIQKALEELEKAMTKGAAYSRNQAGIDLLKQYV